MDALHQRALDVANLTAIEPGMNRFEWDLRYAPATEVIGFKEPTTDNFSASIDGPTIVPGDYTVVLRYGDMTTSRPLRLQLDPRLHPADGDLNERLALEMKVHHALDALDTLLNRAILAEKMAAPAQRERLHAAITSLVNLDIHSSEGDVLHETKVRAELAFLANELETAYEKPTAAEFASFDELNAKAIAGESRLQKVMPTAMSAH
jgi:hypothetical protein